MYSGQFTYNDKAKAGSYGDYSIWSYPDGGSYINYSNNNPISVNLMGVRLYWASTYFHDLLFSPNNSFIYYRNVFDSSPSNWFIIPKYQYIKDNTSLGSSTNPIYINSSGEFTTCDSYPTKSSWNYDDVYLKLSGGTMTGDITFSADNKIIWDRNSDSASISFKNSSNADDDSYMHFQISDDFNEYFRFTHRDYTGEITEYFSIKSDGARVRGTLVSLEGHNHDDLYVPLSGNSTITGTITISPTNTSGWQKGLVLHDPGGGGYEASWIEWTSASYPNGVRLVGAPDSKALYFWDTNAWQTVYHTGNLPAYPTDADTLDGVHNGDVTAQYFSTGKTLTNADTLNTLLSGVYGYINADNPTGSVGNNCIFLGFRNSDRTDTLQIVGDGNGQQLYYRIATNVGNSYENWSGWKTVIDSANYTSYVNPLATSKTIWGQTYIDSNGNFQDVDGRLVLNYAASNGTAAAQFNIGDASYAYGIDVQTTQGDNSTSVSFLFGKNHSTNNQLSGLFYYAGHNSTSNRFGFGFYANDNILNIRADGSVGIGTTSPSWKFDVNGSANATTLYENGSRVITSANISSQSVNYATNAGDADTLDGQDGSYYHIHTSRSYTSVDAMPSGSEGWYNIFTLSDYTDGAVICTIKAFAHTSLTFIASKGYSTHATLQILQYNSPANENYFYVKGVRIVDGGKVQALFNKTSGTSTNINVNINIFSSHGTLRPNEQLTLETGSPTVTAGPLNGTHNKITSDIVGNATSATNDSDGNAINSTYLKKSGGTMTGVINWGTGSTREILQFSTDETWKSGLRYSWSSSTTISLWGKHKNTAFVWHAGTDAEINGHGSTTYDFRIRRESDVVVARIAGNTVYHSGNLPAYPTKASWNYDDVYVSSLTTSGNYLRWVKNGSNNDITVPYSTTAGGINYVINTSITTSGEGWFRVAYANTSNDMVRGLTSFSIITTGGYWSPCVQTVEIDGTWSHAAVINCRVIGNGYITNVRTTYDSSKVYIEIYTDSSVSGSIRVLNDSVNYTNVNSNWGWYSGALPSGGGTQVFILNPSTLGFCTTGGISVSGNAYATNFYSTSDRSKKQNISIFSEHIRKFQLKDTEKWHYGVIAQEVEEMFRDGKEGNMTVNYNSILSYYVGKLENEVKELRKEIKELKSKLYG